MTESKEYLLQIQKLDCMIKNKLAEILRWKTIATGTTGQMGGEKVQSSGNPQKISCAIEKYIDLEIEIEACVKQKREIIRTIEQLNSIEYDVLHKIYVQDFTLQEVAEAHKNSYSWATTVHGRALKNVQTIIDRRKSEKGKE